MTVILLTKKLNYLKKLHSIVKLIYFKK